MQDSERICKALGLPPAEFSDLNSCQLFEDALAKRPFCDRYINFLDELTRPNPPRSADGWEDAWAIVLATPAQRVAAVIKTLDEVGL